MIAFNARLTRAARACAARFYPKSFVGDAKGIAIVEFAMMLPLMLLLYLGLTETFRALRVAQKTDLVAHTIADLVAQQVTGGSGIGQAGLTSSDFQSIFSAGTTMLNGLPTATLSMTVSEIVISGTPSSAPTSWSAKTDWTVTSNGGAARPCATLTPSANAPAISSSTIPTNYVTAANGSNPVTGPIIVADVKYVYDTGIHFTDAFVTWLRWASVGSFTFQRTAFAAVRNTYTPANIQLVGSVPNSTDCP